VQAVKEKCSKKKRDVDRMTDSKDYLQGHPRVHIVEEEILKVGQDATTIS
jgi:hypothetical protein